MLCGKYLKMFIKTILLWFWCLLFPCMIIDLNQTYVIGAWADLHLPITQPHFLINKIDKWKEINYLFLFKHSFCVVKNDAYSFLSSSPFTLLCLQKKRPNYRLCVFSWRSGGIIHPSNVSGIKEKCLPEYSGRYYCNRKEM